MRDASIGSVVAIETDAWLVFFHVLGAMVWVGGLVMTVTLATQVLRGGDADATARFVRNLRVIGPLVLMPATLAVVVFGAWIVLESDAWSLAQTWVRIGVGLYVVALLIGAIFQSRWAIRADRAATAGDHAEARRQLQRWFWGMWLILAVLVVATWDMVAKPGL
jgi:uncharacterized membrane protein